MTHTTDLFDCLETLPIEVQALFNSDQECESYEQLNALILQANALGYTFDYDLDAQPYNLRRLKTIVDSTDKIAEGFKNPMGMVVTPSMRSAVAEHVKNHIKTLHKLKKN